MPKSLSHVIVFAPDLDVVVTFLTEHAGLGPVVRYDAEPEGMSELFGWPIEHARTRGAMLGSGPGMLEVVEIPEALRDRVTPGLALLAVPQRDAAETARALRDAGIAARGPIELPAPGGTLLRIVASEVGGLPFELVEFASAER